MRECSTHRPLLDTLAAPRDPSPVDAALEVPTFCDAVPVLMNLIVAGSLVPVRWGRGWRLLLLPRASVTVAFLSASAIKDAMARARPAASGWAAPARGFAFPSGHATPTTAGYFVLARLVSGLNPMARHGDLVLGPSPAREPAQ